MRLSRNFLCHFGHMRFQHFLQRQMTHECHIEITPCVQHVFSGADAVIRQRNPVDCPDSLTVLLSVNVLPRLDFSRVAQLLLGTRGKFEM